MALPQKVRVKLSTEAAGAISITPVVVQELAVRELIEHMLGVAGKDEPRIRQILMRGTLVNGASRFRWTGWDPDIESLRELLATFPDPEPQRPFAVERCFRAILHGGRHAIELPREALARKSLFQRSTFWDLLMEVVLGGSAAYSGYSYRERADHYTRDLSVGEAERLRTGSGIVKFSTLSEQIRSVGFSSVELYVAR